MMVGTVVFEFSHEGRSLDLKFSVLKGGDTGSADVTVGNSFLRSDRDMTGRLTWARAW